MEKPCAAEGPMLKKSVWLKKWKSRYFRLRGRTLCYYETPTSKLARGEIPLVGSQVVAPFMLTSDPQHDFVIMIKTSSNQEHLLSCSSQQDMDRWVAIMNVAIQRGPVTKAGLQKTTQPPSSLTSTSTTSTSATCMPSPDAVAESSESNSAEDVVLGIGAEKQLYALSEERQRREKLMEQEEEERKRGFAGDVPPPPPPNATDPLSYLMTIHVPAVKVSKDKQSEKKDDRNASATSRPSEQGVGLQSNSSPDKPPVPTRRTGVADADVEKTASIFARAATTVDSDAASSEEVSGAGLRGAVKKGDVVAVKKILDAEPSLSKFVDNQQQSVLHVAAMFKHEDICLLLIEAGADPTLQNRQGESALDIAPLSLRNKMSAAFQNA